MSRRRRAAGAEPQHDQSSRAWRAASRPNRSGAGLLRRPWFRHPPRSTEAPCRTVKRSAPMVCRVYRGLSRLWFKLAVLLPLPVEIPSAIGQPLSWCRTPPDQLGSQAREVGGGGRCWRQSPGPLQRAVAVSVSEVIGGTEARERGRIHEERAMALSAQMIVEPSLYR